MFQYFVEAVSAREREAFATGPMATPAMPGKYEFGAELKMPRPVVPVARLVAPVLLKVVNAPVLGVVAPMAVEFRPVEVNSP